MSAEDTNYRIYIEIAIAAAGMNQYFEIDYTIAFTEEIPVLDCVQTGMTRYLREFCIW